MLLLKYLKYFAVSLPQLSWVFIFCPPIFFSSSVPLLLFSLAYYLTTTGITLIASIDKGNKQLLQPSPHPNCKYKDASRLVPHRRMSAIVSFSIEKGERDKTMSVSLRMCTMNHVPCTMNMPICRWMPWMYLSQRLPVMLCRWYLSRA